MAKEFKVGVMVVLGLIILAGMLFFFGDYKYILFQKGYELRVPVDYTGGLRVGAPVRLLGVRIGEVKSIAPPRDPATQVEIVLWINSSVRIRVGARAYISTLGIVGDKYVEICPGLGDKPVLQPGALIPGMGPVRSEDLVRTARALGEEITCLANSINKVIGTKEVQEALQETIINMRELSGNLKSITTTLERIVSGHKEGIETTLVNLQESAKTLNKELGPALTNVEKLTAGASDFLADNRESMEKIITNFEEVSYRLNEFIKLVETHPTILLRGRRGYKKLAEESSKGVTPWSK